MRKSVSVTLCTALALSLVLAGSLMADEKKNKGKREPSPALTSHEMMIDYYYMFGSIFTSSPDNRSFENTSTGNRYHTGAIVLPTNATITGITMRAIMGHNYSSDNDRLITYLYRRNDYGNLVLIKQVKANYVAGNSNYRTKSSSFSVAATDQPYIVVVKVPGTDLVTDIAYKCTWVKVTYTTP